MRVPGRRPMYSSARSLALVARLGGSGTRPVIGTVCPGFVPQVTCGASADASTRTSRRTSRRRRSAAPTSARRARPNAPCDAGPALEVGERRLVGSDQARARARIRSTCCRPSCGLPSRARGSPRPRTRRRSRSPRPRSPARSGRGSGPSPSRRGPAAPSKTQRIVFARFWTSVCVASTCSTSLVPMPNASAPNAPCVEVCQSPHTIVMPGCVRPSSGPITWTMPWRACPRP